MEIPVIAVSGQSCAEKTAFVESLSAVLRAKGMRVALRERGMNEGGEADLILTENANGATASIEALTGDAEAAAEFIIEQIGRIEPCWYPYVRLREEPAPEPPVSLTVDGKSIPLLPFVQDVFRQVSLALVQTLRDTGATRESEIRIVIKPDNR